ncbi:MAG: tetratricopeptide repeat protein, partial [Congregibacter sp.]|nr:tetratricopeptide repeat protein [Congregibacter sp.]
VPSDDGVDSPVVETCTATDAIAALPGSTEASIAVLPFADLSAAGDQEYFADGISEELLNVLAKVKGMKVAGRTSSFAFKGRNEDLREIGRVLNVANILEGSVRTEGDKVRVTAQLIQVSDGFHLWSETYDRDLTSIFAVQDDIAQQILTAMKTELQVDVQDVITPSTRTDIGAYGLFLEARDLIASRDVDKMTRARGLLDQAIEIDPAYAPAYAARAQALLLLTDRPSSYGDIPQHIATPKVQADVQKALELDPNLAHAHAVQGLLSNDEGRPDSAMASLRRALELNPNSLDARNWLALTLVDTGQFRAGLDQLVALLAIDPLYGPAVNNGMLYSEEIGDLEGAKDIARTYIRRSRNPTTTAFYTARIAALEGRVADMIVTLESVPEDSPDTRVAQWLSFGYGWLGEFGAALTVPGLSTDAAMTRQADVGDPVKAVKALSEKLALNPTIVNVQRRYIQALSRSGADQALLKFYQDTYAGDLDIFATRMQGASARSMVQPFKELALAMNATGNLSALPTVMQRWKETIDAFRAGGSRSGSRDIDEAEYWAMSGDVDKSVTLLTQAYEKMSFLAPYDFRDRAFDSLQQDSRFVALRERAREDLNQQRAFMDWPPLDSEFFINRLLLGGQ